MAYEKTERLESRGVPGRAWAKKTNIISGSNEVIYWEYLYNCYLFNADINAEALFGSFTQMVVPPQEKKRVTLKASDVFYANFRDIPGEFFFDLNYVMQEMLVVYHYPDQNTEAASYINLIFKFWEKDPELNRRGQPTKIFSLNVHVDKVPRPNSTYDDMDNIECDGVIDGTKLKLVEFCKKLSTGEAVNALKAIKEVSGPDAKYTIKDEDEFEISVVPLFVRGAVAPGEKPRPDFSQLRLPREDGKAAGKYIPPAPRRDEHDFRTVRQARYSNDRWANRAPTPQSSALNRNAFLPAPGMAEADDAEAALSRPVSPLSSNEEKKRSPASDSQYAQDEQTRVVKKLL